MNQEKWILEGLSQEIFYKKAGEALRQIKKSYRKNYFYRNINCDWSDPLKYLPPDFPPEQWPVLVNQWSDPHYVVSFALLNNSSNILLITLFISMCIIMKKL